MKHHTRIIIAGTLGNLVESYDMSICGLLSLYLAKYLYGSIQTGLIVVFVTIFLGYLARPFGALVMGLFSDSYGRKITLAASILVMGVATTLIGFIPSNTVIGLQSLYLLLLLRILQSFSCGAEYLNSSAYLVENASPTRKGFSGSWASFGAMAGLLLASLITLGISYLNNLYPEFEWVLWRFPFLLALLGSSIGLYIRVCIPESKEYVLYYAHHPRPKLIYLFNQSFRYIRQDKLTTLYVFSLSCLGVSSTFQIYIYGPTQAHLSGIFSDHFIFLSNIISLIVLLLVFPIIGTLSDKLKREKIVITASLGLLILSPFYFYFLFYGTLTQLILIQCLISVPAGAYYATVPVLLAELFPMNLRCTVLSVLYSIAASLAAGLTPLLSLVLLNKTLNPYSPSLIIIFLVFCVWIMIFLRRKKQQPLIYQGVKLRSYTH